MIQQLNMLDKRVAKWYEDVEKHSESGRCTGDNDCPGCARLLRRNAELRAIPGLLVSSAP